MRGETLHGLQQFSVGVVISPALQKEKKLVVEAAHNMTDLYGCPD